MTGLLRFAVVTNSRTAEAIESLLEEAGDPRLAAIGRSEDAPGVWMVEALYTDAPTRNELAEILKRGLGRMPTFDLAPLPERDWVAESLRGLAPVAAGRFVVHGSHDRDAVPPGALGIEIEAGAAFGTGHHATTRGCLEALTIVARAGGTHNALDLGTGSGVLAIAAAKLMRAPVVATDIDPAAVRVARNNARLNGVAPLVRTAVADGARAPLIRSEAPYSVVFGNILARPLMLLARPVAELVSQRSKIILSGLLKEQAAMVLAPWRAHGFGLARHIGIDGWSTLVLVRARRW